MQRVKAQIDKLSFHFDTIWFLDVLYNVDIKVVEADKCVAETACVYIKNYKINMEFNKKFLDSLNEDELLGLILHETLHLALYHSVRDAGKHNPQLWNVACDLEVNSIICGLNIKIPKGGLLPDQFNLPAKLSAECYYKALEDNGYAKQQALISSILDDHSSWSKSTTEAQLQKSVIDSVVKEAINKNVKDIDKSTMSDNIVNALREAMQSSDPDNKSDNKLYGNAPGDFVKDIQALGQGTQSWNVILNRLIRRNLSSSYISSFKRTSRRYGELVKGKIRNRKVDNIMIAVDTSGSIDTELHEKFLEEILLIRRMFKIDIRYVQCDTIIQDDRKLQRYTKINSIEIKGGGGTDFRPVFDYIKEKHYKPDALLYFTDGYGSYPETSNINTLWVLSDKSCLEEYKPPFGEIVFL